MQFSGNGGANSSSPDQAPTEASFLEPITPLGHSDSGKIVQEQLSLIESTRGEQIDLLQRELHQLQRERRG